MSISTKKGDEGTTRLMFNRPVSKDDPRVEAYGTVDELNSALGMARAVGSMEIRSRMESVQRHLVALMAGLAVLPEDAARYEEEGYPRLGAEAVAELDAWVGELDGGGTRFRGWVMPGGTIAGAALDYARTICRRAERRVFALHRASPVEGVILQFLNRLSDLLWLLAREAEEAPPGD